MPYLKESIKSGCVWLNPKETSSQSGCRIDWIYGYGGIGSPHGHLVLFNGSIVYSRNLDDIIAEPCGTQIIINKK